MNNWTKKYYSRLLIDNHITDIHPSFMTKFDSSEYVRMVELSGCETSMVYACDHNGNCYYPTKVGHPHANLNGRDFFGEVVSKLREKNIVPIAYYTVVYHNYSVELFPDSAQLDIKGNDFNRRYRVSCPNHKGVLEHYKKELEEIIKYPVEGIFIDMSFWAMLCCCPHCRRKFKERYGRDIPTVIDWDDENWRNYAAFRRETVAEFAQELTDFVRAKRPDMTVVHQGSGLFNAIDRGQCGLFRTCSDYCSGDLYGDRSQLRFGTKMFDSYTSNRPYEYMTSRCVSLNDHTSTKHDDDLMSHAMSILANGGAYFFIDAINPDGTLEEDFYRRLGDLNRKLTPFREAVRDNEPALTSEIAIYYSPATFSDTMLNGTKFENYASQRIMAAESSNAMKECIGTGDVLSSINAAFRILTETSENWNEFKYLIVNNAADLTDKECERMREFVRNGGTLIATGCTSLIGDNFKLSDVMGIDYCGEKSLSTCYIKYNNKYVSATRSAPYVKAHADTEVKAILNVPMYPIFDRDVYASIHSNPPGIDTEYAAWTEHKFGKGKCVFLAVNVFGIDQTSQREFSAMVLKNYLPQSICCDGDIPEAIEVTTMKCNDGSLMISFINVQKEFPMLDVCDLDVAVPLPDNFKAAAIERVSDKAVLPVEYNENGKLKFHCDRIKFGEMFLVKKG